MKIKNFKLKIFAVMFLLQISTGIVLAQEPTISPTLSPVEYTLPYPGLLPDHPLYFLRVMRDTMQEILVSNPLKRAEFYQLQSDKDISASLVLSQKKGTVVLAAATAEKALIDYDKAIEAAMAAKRQGGDIHEITTKLVVSNTKHVEVLSQIQDSVKKSDQAAFTKAEAKARNLGKKAKALLPAK